MGRVWALVLFNKMAMIKLTRLRLTSKISFNISEIILHIYDYNKVKYTLQHQRLFYSLFHHMKIIFNVLL